MDREMNKSQSRREFIGRSVTALAAASFIPSVFSCTGKGKPGMAPSEANPMATKVDSNFGGVQVGAITYSWRSMPGGLENVIHYCQQANVSSIELMSADLERYLGAPESVPGQPGETHAMEMREWRLALDLSKVEAARALLDKAGIDTHIVKFSPSRWSDEEIDYAFKVAKTMGAKAVTDEISLESAQRLAPFAEKHDLFIAFHNHMQYAEEGFSCDPILAVSPAVMLNFDAGHFYGSTGIHPNEMIRRYHDRIYSIHVKDKTGPVTEGQPNTNQVWGQGEMPIADILLLIQQEKWPIYCDIELEYDVKPWSDSVKEVGKCVKFMREILI